MATAICDPFGIDASIKQYLRRPASVDFRIRGGTPLPLSTHLRSGATFNKFTYDEIVARDKANLDMLLSAVSAALRLWLKDESLEDTENLPPPAELAAEIVESLEAALAEFRAVEELLGKSET